MNARRRRHRWLKLLIIALAGSAGALIGYTAPISASNQIRAIFSALGSSVATWIACVLIYGGES